MNCSICDTPGAMFVDDELNVCPEGCGDLVQGSGVTRWGPFVIVSTVEVVR